MANKPSQTTSKAKYNLLDKCEALMDEAVCSKIENGSCGEPSLTMS